MFVFCALQSLKHQRNWKTDANYTKDWYDRGKKVFQADKYRKGACTKYVPFLGYPFVLVPLHVLTCCVCSIDTMVNLRELSWISLCNFIL
jgi:hypothetical protein